MARSCAIPRAKPTLKSLYYKTYLFDIGDFAPKGGPREAKPRERDLDELLHPDVESTFYKENAAKIRSEIHERLSTPIYSLLFALLAVVYLGRPRTTREGSGSLLFTAFVIGAAIRIAGIAGVNIVGKQLWGLSLIYGLPVLGIILSLLLLSLNISAPAFALPSIRLPLPSFFSGRKAQVARPS